MQAQRQELSLHEVGDQIGLASNTLSRVERGDRRPSLDTALKLAAWLGWTVEEVVAAADERLGGDQ